MPLARITGEVLDVEHRNGTSAASGQPYSMTVLRVLVANRDVTELVLGRTFAGRVPDKGHDVDLLCRFDLARSGRLSSTVVEPWPTLVSADAL